MSIAEIFRADARLRHGEAAIGLDRLFWGIHCRKEAISAVFLLIA